MTLYKHSEMLAASDLKELLLWAVGFEGTAFKNRLGLLLSVESNGRPTSFTMTISRLEINLTEFFRSTCWET
jgi:hypothetical protein